MGIKLDEDLPGAAAVLLRDAGYDDVRTVRDQGMGGFKDPVLWRAVQEEGRLLITADKGFADVRAYPPGLPPSPPPHPLQPWYQTWTSAVVKPALW